MRVEEFDFDLPESLIAVEAIEPRDASRMLHVKGGLDDLAQTSEPWISDRQFRDLSELLREGDLLIYNDTKVIHACLTGFRLRANTQAKISLNLNRPLPNGEWSAFARPAKKIAIGDDIIFSEKLSGVVTKKGERGEITLNFSSQNIEELHKLLNEVGEVPLPPYISSKRKVDQRDIERYQTTYAKKPGAVAAPTAGLHFTDELRNVIRNKGVQEAFVTLHVSGGTFLPVKVDDTKDHFMHSEFAILTQDVANKINETRKNGGRIIATGTTALRVIESAALKGIARPFNGDTQIFITPGYQFQLVDCLITNFHLPKSTLFMLVSAFCGTARMKAAYNHAIDRQYRFYSYGDACFLER